MDISTTLKALRKKHGITQEVLSERTGIRAAQISKMETNPSNPTLATLTKIAAAFGMRVKLVAVGEEGRTS